MRVIVGCEFSQIVTKAFRQRGHEAYSCDLEPTEGNPEWHFQEDILDVLKREKFDLGIFHPPCTFLSVTGAKWFYHPDDKELPMDQKRPHPRFPNRRHDQKDAIEFFMKLINAPCEKICVENPVGIMSSMYRKPDQIVQPYEFGHPEPKKTCFWLKNLPLLQPTKLVEPEYSITKKTGKRVPSWFFNPSPSEKRNKDRNRTFTGIAEAMSLQWGS